MKNSKNETKKTETANVCKAVLEAMPPQRQEALVSNEYPELVGELNAFSSISYNPTEKHINMIAADGADRDKVKAELAKDSLVRFRVGSNKQHLLIFASVIRSAAEKAKVEPFVELPNGKFAIKKGLPVRTAPKKFEFVQ